MRIDTEKLINEYKDHVFAAAFGVCKNPDDANDVVQETFIKYHLSNKQFDSKEHIRAWLIREAINNAKDLICSSWKRKNEPLDNYINILEFETPQAKNLLEHIMALPQRYRIVIFLFYNEDYKIKEIADILKISENNVKVRLNRARKMLKKSLKEEWEND